MNKLVDLVGSAGAALTFIAMLGVENADIVAPLSHPGTKGPGSTMFKVAPIKPITVGGLSMGADRRQAGQVSAKNLSNNMNAIPEITKPWL
jgi:hypothetical protein